jgi:uncharacterized RDD family membrane protein YckC
VRDTTAGPGYYPAQGDPPGTVRYWSGEQWVGDPVPETSGYVPPTNIVDKPYAGLRIRIGAALIDGVAANIVVAPVLWPELRDAFEANIQSASPTFDFSISPALVALSLGWTLVTWLMISRFGGSVGKLTLGLRVTHEDGETTPPGYTKGAMRSIPDVVSLIPLPGSVVVLGFTISSLVWVSTDPERRSAYDRIAGTRSPSAG